MALGYISLVLQRPIRLPKAKGPPPWPQIVYWHLYVPITRKKQHSPRYAELPQKNATRQLLEA